MQRADGLEARFLHDMLIKHQHITTPQRHPDARLVQTQGLRHDIEGRVISQQLGTPRQARLLLTHHSNIYFFHNYLFL